MLCFNEIDIESSKVLFEWSSSDQLSTDESVLLFNEDQAGAGVQSFIRTSSSNIIKVNTKNLQLKLIQNYLQLDDLLSKSQGTTQTLPNGHVIDS